MRRLLKYTRKLFEGLVLISMLIWCTLAVYYSNLPGELLRTAIATVFLLGWIAAFLVSRRREWVAGAFVLGFLMVLVWWVNIPASNDRVWQPEVAVLPYATFDGDLVTLHNIRNFEYKTESDFIPRYYDKTFDLQKLESVDLIACYWMGPDIAHIFLSFGFRGENYLAISIETRKEVGEDYSTIKGFFKQYELFYVVADERDVIRLRTNYRKDPPEQVFLYRAQGPIENGRRIFLDYLKEINSLVDRPEFYNTLTTNCTTNILMHSRVNPESPAFSWKILLSGHSPEYLYDNGRLDTTLPFEELQKRSLINAAAQAADAAQDFSRRIRQGLPGMAENTTGSGLG